MRVDRDEDGRAAADPAPAQVVRNGGERVERVDEPPLQLDDPGRPVAPAVRDVGVVAHRRKPRRIGSVSRREGAARPAPRRRPPVRGRRGHARQSRLPATSASGSARSFASRVELDAEEAEPLAHACAHEAGVLADAAREGECVEAAERGRHRRDCRREPVREDLEREPRARLCGSLQLLDARRDAREPEQARLVLERPAEFVGVEATRAQKVQDDLGVEGARAGRHRDAVERAEPHRRVDRVAVEDSRDRAAAAQVQNDEPRGRRPLGRPLHREAVEPVAPDAPLLGPSPRHRVGRSLVRHRRVEGRIEDGHVRDVGQQPARLVDRRQRRAVVERRELDQRRQLGQHGLVEEHGLEEAARPRARRGGRRRARRAASRRASRPRHSTRRHRRARASGSSTPR